MQKLTVDLEGGNQFNGRCLGLSRRKIGEIEDLRVGDRLQHVTHRRVVAGTHVGFVFAHGLGEKIWTRCPLREPSKARPRASTLS